jgi:peptide/nickel transport system substrate-binding protein
MYAHRRLLAAPAVLPLILMTACSGGGGTAKPSIAAATADDRAVKNGGTLTMALSADPDALDPSTSVTLLGREVFTSICEKLYDIDANATIVPQLASALPDVSGDGKTVTIKLRGGVRFNDGTAFDAAAVKKSLDRHRTWKRSARTADLAAVDKVEVVDPATVRLTLSRPYSPLTAQLADRAGMVMSPKALDAEGDDFGAHPVCVGPFTFAGRTSGSQIVVDRAPGYYDAAKVKLDRVVYKIIVDPNVRAANLKSGDVQAAEELANTTVAGVQADPDLRVVSGGGLGYYGVQINIGNAHGSTEKPGPIGTPLGRSPELRQAFELSLDRAAINKAVYNGLNQPDCDPLPLNSRFRDESRTCSPRDVAQARRLVAASGIKPPIPVKLQVPNDATNQRLGQVIQQMTKETGFAVSVQPIDFATGLEQGAAGRFDAMQVGWSGRIDPDGNLTGQITTGGQNNYAGLSDPGIDDPIRQAAATDDAARRTRLYSQAIQRQARLRGMIYLYHQLYYLGMRKDVAGVRYYADGLPRLGTAGFAAR